MGAPVDKYKHQKIVAAQHAAMGTPDKDIAKAVGVCRATIAKWKKQPGFHKQMQLWRAKVALAVEAEALNAAERAVKFLVDGMDDETLVHSERRRCAMAILDLVPLKYLEHGAAEALRRDKKGK